MQKCTKKKILFLITSQFGYHTDTFMYCKYIDKNVFEVSYLCFDMALPKVSKRIYGYIMFLVKGIRCCVILIFIYKLVIILNKHRYDIVFHVHTKFALIIPSFTLNHFMVLDIRTGNVSSNTSKRLWKNLSNQICIMIYPFISVISESLANKLHISRNKRIIIPLGGE